MDSHEVEPSKSDLAILFRRVGVTEAAIRRREDQARLERQREIVGPLLYYVLAPPNTINPNANVSPSLIKAREETWQAMTHFLAENPGVRDVEVIRCGTSQAVESWERWSKVCDLMAPEVELVVKIDRVASTNIVNSEVAAFVLERVGL